MSVKECGHDGENGRKVCRRIFSCLLITILLILITILLIWAILRPSKPSFTLQDVTVYTFNTSTPNSLSSNIQVTIASRNPNDGIGIYYDRLDTYASYENQQITLRTGIPPTYQGHNEVTVWSPFVLGDSVPISPYNSAMLGQQQSSGAVLLIIKMDGRVRWKVGAFVSGRYHLYVRCPAYISFQQGTTGGFNTGENDVVKYQVATRCSVSV